jgi:hypothetical protein
VDLSVVPDLTMHGQDDPHGRALGVRPPTVGQLAARVRELAARPDEWWRLVRFDAAEPRHIPLDDEAGLTTGLTVWLTTWPPGHGGTVHGGGVSTLVAGELAVVTITERGVTERPLRANRIRVHGSSQALTNPGPAFAVTLHAQSPAR